METPVASSSSNQPIVVADQHPRMDGPFDPVALRRLHEVARRHFSLRLCGGGMREARENRADPPKHRDIRLYLRRQRQVMCHSCNVHQRPTDHRELQHYVFHAMSSV